MFAIKMFTYVNKDPFIVNIFFLEAFIAVRFSYVLSLCHNRSGLREGEGTYNVIATMEEFITERPKGGESKNIY